MPDYSTAVLSACGIIVAMTKTLFIDIIGWLGVVLLLVAYGLVSSKRLDGDSTLYQVLNLVGSALVVVNSADRGAYPSVGVNVVWIVIALATLASVWRRKRYARKSSA